MQESALETWDGTEEAQPAPTSAGSTKRNKRTVLIASSAALALALIGGGSWAAVAHKTVSLDVDENVQSVSTWGKNVSDVLAAADVKLGEYDEVAPGLDTKLREGSEIVVRRAHEIDLIVNGETRSVWTTAASAADAVAQLSLDSANVRVTASRSSQRADKELPFVQEGTELPVYHDGFIGSVVAEKGDTVDDLLEKAVVNVRDGDQIRADINLAGEPLLQVVRVDTTEVVDVQPIAFSTEKTTDDEMYKDEKKVTQKGVPGERTIVNRVVTEDLQPVSIEQISNTVTKEPVVEKVTVGTKDRPAGAPAPAGAQGAAPSTGVWAALAKCESGGNPSVVSRNGLYHGLYQFSVGTWRSVGGSGLPSQASAEEQTQRAQALQARSGWGQWPACSRKLGLR
ncbi:MAG: transglycosylase family protein [Actinomycetaceae bacterium]|nr:transglycosylase family protein [Actinomycetaceae bacterium]